MQNEDGVVEKITQLQNGTMKLFKQLNMMMSQCQSQSEKLQILSNINFNLHELEKLSPAHLQPFAEDRLIIYIRFFFPENGPKIHPLQYFRLILVSDIVAQKLLQYNIPLYVGRVIEKEDTKNKSMYTEEATQALNFIGRWIQRFPSSFPLYLGQCLVRFAELPVMEGFQEKKKEAITHYMKNQAVKIVLKMSMKIPRICGICGGFTLLMNSITDPELEEQSLDIISKILFYMNEKVNRDLILVYMDIRKLAYYFTNIDNALQDRGSQESLSKFQSRLKMSKYAIITLLKSWTGMIFLGSDQNALRSVLQALKQIPNQQNSFVRRQIFSILEEIIGLGDNIIANTFFQSNVFRLSNLIACYLVSLIQLLIESDLLKVLIELSGVDQTYVSEPAQKLLKKITLLIFNFLPKSSKYIDFLIYAATQNITSDLIKSSSSFVMNKIGNYIYDKKSKYDHTLFDYLENLFSLKTIFIPFHRISVNSISKSLNFITYQEKGSYRKNLFDEGPILKQHKNDFTKWKWHLIEELLLHPDTEKLKSKPDTNQKYKESKMYKYMLRFYSPSRGAFIKQAWSMQNFIHVKVGLLLVKNVITIPQNLPLVKNPPQSQFELTVSFIGDLQNFLHQTIDSFIHDKNRMDFYTTMERELFSWISLFSENQIGYQVLICENNIFERLYSCVHRKECSHLLSLFLINLDFYRQNRNKPKTNMLIGPKALLEKCVREGSKQLKLACLEVIKILFKAEITNFQGFGYTCILLMLKDQSQEVRQNVIEFLQDHLYNSKSINSFMECLQCSRQKFPKNELTKLLSNNIIIHLLTEDPGFDFINSCCLNWLDSEYEQWIQSNKTKDSYCLKIQKMLSQSLRFIEQKEKRFRIYENKNIYDMLFLYKLPLILYFNNSQYPLWVKQSQNTYNFFVQFEEQECVINVDRVSIMLGIGAMFVDEQFNQTKEKNSFMIFLKQNEKKVELYGQKYQCVSGNGISIYYRTSEKKKVFEIRRVQIKLQLNSSRQNERLPLHLIEELTKTEKGLNYIKRKNFIEYVDKVLKGSDDGDLMQVRSVLWAIGYYGAVNEGFEHMRETGIVKRVVKMALDCDTLSLRGTCRYILNMFCHCENGRQFLPNHGFYVDRRSLSCYPDDLKLFFHVTKTQQRHYCRSEKVWQVYEQSLLPLTSPNQIRLFEQIKLLINSVSFKSSAQLIRQILKLNPKVTHSFPLLQNVITHLSFFTYKHESRKNVIHLFDDFIRSREFNTLDEKNKLMYVIGEIQY